MEKFYFNFKKNAVNFSFLKAFFFCFITFLSQSSLAQTVTITTTGNGTFTVPCDVTSITVEAWGGGGAGGGDDQNYQRGGGGGAGGSYASSVLTVTPGQVMNYNVGAGGNGDDNSGNPGGPTWFNTTGTLYAQGGAGGAEPTGGTVAGGVGSTAASIGTTLIAGTNGANGTNTVGGAGGAGANGGGAGGAQRNNSEGDGNNGTPPGGGGGGAYIPDTTDHDGGSGGNGQIRITYTSPSSFQIYCSPTYDDGVRPITNVTFGAINNTTSAAINVTPEIETFCQMASVVQGSATNAISVKGNTNGNNTYYFRVYIDWDQNGTLGNNANEIYNLGTIRNSNGTTTGVPPTLTGNISVPGTATIGITKMRVMSRYDGYSNGPCQTTGTNNYGQAEDYLVEVTSPTPTITTFPASACAGSSIVINGTNLNGATAVTIGGTAATITANNNTTVTVTVGNGTTGPISVVTPGGVATTLSNLTVNPVPATPANPTTDSPQCSAAGVTITANGSAPGGETWYWQTSATGISTANNASTPLIITTVGTNTHFIRSYNGTCWSNAGNATVTVNQTPIINTQPLSPATLCAGQGTLTLNINASGATTYQWQRNGVNVPNNAIVSGGTTQTLTLTNPTVANAGIYTVILNDATCPVTSNPVTVTINDAPATPANPSSNTPQCTPTGATITAVGTIPVGETWYWQTTAGGTSMANDASTPLVITTVGTYTRYIRAYNGTCWSTGAGSTTVTINQTPTINAQPATPAAVCAGQGTVTLNVNASGVTSFQWQRNGVNVTNAGVFSGADTQTLTITNPAVANAGTYTVVLNGTTCPVTSDAVIVTVDAAPATPGNPTSNTPQCTPTGVTITAAGTIPSGVTWYWQTTAGGTSMADDASIPLVISAAGTHTIYIRAFNGTCWSAGAGSRTVTVNQTPTITTQPVAPAQLCTGQGNISISVAAINFTTFQWQRNGVNLTNGGVISGATTATLTLTNPTVANAGAYTVVLNNATCPVISDAVAVVINALPTNPGIPTSDTPQCNPTGVTLTRNGTPPADVEWYWQTVANGTNMSFNGITYTVNTTGTYYSRAYNTVTGCWSSGAGARAVVVNNPISTLANNPTPANNATGVCYAGNGALTALTWTAAAGATSYDVYFDTSATPVFVGNRTVTNYTPGGGLGLLPNTTYYWKIVPKNICGDTLGTVITWSFTTSSLPCYCVASVSNGQQDDNYIDDVRFLGTLNDVNNLNTGYSNNPVGYQDFTGLANRAIQSQGEGVNVFLENDAIAQIRAWVDWNNDGVFNATGTEAVYTSGTISAFSTTFGFVIPAAQTPGLYRIRMRISNGGTITSCGNINADGETEDYLFEVVPSCSAVITSIISGESCGLPLGGNVSVPLSVQVSAGTTEVRWYSALTGGSLVQTTSVSGSSSSWAPSIATTTTYYVTSFNGTCESLVRTAIVAKVKPVANITYTPNNPESCGEDSIVTLTAAGDNEVVTLIDEDFEAATLNGLGVFSLQTLGNNNATANWRRRQSTFIPDEQVWFPAISSGFGANKFAMATSDLNLGSFNNALRSPTTSTAAFLNLTLTFRMYYSDYNPSATTDNVSIEISTNGGTTWTNFHTYNANVGIGTHFSQQSFDMSAYVNQPNFRFRFRYSSGWADGVAIDDIKLFGVRPLAPSFSWVGVPAVAAYTDAGATIPYVSGTPATTVYIRPTLAQLELGTYNFTATATLANGCTTSQPITITNKSRVWKGTASQDWNDPNNWLPFGVPTIDNCVIIPSISKIQNAPEALAKNIIIKSTGDLEILSDNNLRVKEWVRNEGTNNFSIRDKASLIQEDNIANTGPVLMDRILSLKKTDYTYYSSPVDNNNITTLSPGTPAAVKFKWEPTTNAGAGFVYGDWINPGSEIMALGKGYIVRGPSSFNATPQSFTASFLGTPRNGNIQVPINRGNYTGANTTHNGRLVTRADDNYNLIGNPYPSAIFANAFLSNAQNSNILGSIYLWPHGGVISAANPDPFYQDFVYNYNSADYITYNSMGSVPPLTFDGYIAAGQAFFVLMTDTGNSSENVYFNNAMRVSGNNAQFLRTATDSINNSSQMADLELHRIWLDIVLPDGKTSSTLVGYTPEATYGDDRLFDTPIIDNATQSLYSKIDEDAMIIQGRPFPFEETEQVPLGVLLSQQGIHTITINSLDGIFAEEQQHIYLEDLETGIIHNLKNAPYMFSGAIGRNDNRFILRYNNDTTLEVPEIVNTSELEIIKIQSLVKVTSKSTPISSIAVYDILGRTLIQFNKLDTTQFEIPLDRLSQGTLIVKATLQNGRQKTKKVIY